MSAPMLMALVLLASPPADAELERLMRGEPTIEAVQQAAIEYAHCEPETMRRLLRDARAFGALPDVDFGGSIDGDDKQDLDPFDNVEGSSHDESWKVSLELEWDLGDLVMSYERIRVLAEQQRRVEQRQEVLEEVTAVYFDRLRTKAHLELGPTLEPTERALLKLQLQELTARLDGLTGGRFTDGERR